MEYSGYFMMSMKDGSRMPRNYDATTVPYTVRLADGGGWAVNVMVTTR